MSVEKIIAMIKNELSERGYRGQIMSADCIFDLRNEIENKNRQGLFNDQFYSERLTCFDYNIPDGFYGPVSLIIVAAPQSPVMVTFKLHGRSLKAIIPPTYSYETDRAIQALLKACLYPNGFKVKRANLPEKQLAVRSGLAKYGKNNISYVDGIGSYFRLAAFISDLPATENHWEEEQVLRFCKNCNACRNACPTGAISADRFLLYGEKCLTFHNERRGDFPSWIKASWHNCLVGCLYCQQSCPVNKEINMSIAQGPIFSNQETELIVKGACVAELNQNTRHKLEQLLSIKHLPILGRNLQLLI
jgi:epoxyqueuosine reductase